MAAQLDGGSPSPGGGDQLGIMAGDVLSTANDVISSTGSLMSATNDVTPIYGQPRPSSVGRNPFQIHSVPPTSNDSPSYSQDLSTNASVPVSGNNAPMSTDAMSASKTDISSAPASLPSASIVSRADSSLQPSSEQNSSGETSFSIQSSRSEHPQESVCGNAQQKEQCTSLELAIEQKGTSDPQSCSPTLLPEDRDKSSEQLSEQESSSEPIEEQNESSQQLPESNGISKQDSSLNTSMEIAKSSSEQLTEQSRNSQLEAEQKNSQASMPEDLTNDQACEQKSSTENHLVQTDSLEQNKVPKKDTDDKNNCTTAPKTSPSAEGGPVKETSESVPVAEQTPGNNDDTSVALPVSDPTRIKDHNNQAENTALAWPVQNSTSSKEQPANLPQINSPNEQQHQSVRSPRDIIKSVRFCDDPVESAAEMSQPDYTAAVTDTSTLSEEDEAATDDFLGSMADASLAGAGDAADFAAFFDFPSLNEVKELLPGVLKELAPPPPQPTIIPEPKLINREESRANLVSHVEHLHALVEDRLTGCETRLDQLLDNTSIGKKKLQLLSEPFESLKNSLPACL